MRAARAMHWSFLLAVAGCRGAAPSDAPAVARVAPDAEIETRDAASAPDAAIVDASASSVVDAGGVAASEVFDLDAWAAAHGVPSFTNDQGCGNAPAGSCLCREAFALASPGVDFVRCESFRVENGYGLTRSFVNVIDHGRVRVAFEGDTRIAQVSLADEQLVGLAFIVHDRREIEVTDVPRAGAPAAQERCADAFDQFDVALRGQPGARTEIIRDRRPYETMCAARGRYVYERGRLRRIAK